MSLAIPVPSVPTVVSFVRAAVTTAVVAAVAPEVASALLVTAVVAGASWYYFSQKNKEALQAKALDKFCMANGSAAVCKVIHTSYRSGANEHLNSFVMLTYPEAYKALGRVNYTNTQGQFVESTTPGAIAIQNIEFSSNNRTAFAGTITLVKATAWKDLDQATRQAAVDSLSDDDWKNVIESMPEGGTLTKGQALTSDTVALNDARHYPSGTRVLSPEAAEIVNALQGDLDALKAEIRELPYSLNHQGLGSLGASLATLAGVARNTDKNVADIGKISAETNNSVKAMQASMNENFDKVKKRLKSIVGFLNFDRILNLMIWWQTLHNCFMLSADLSRSLVSAFGTALKALPGDSLLGLPTESEDGSPLDLATTINKYVETWIKGAIGAKNYKLMALELMRINRIYQSGANIFSSTASALDSFRSVTADGFARIGQIGNALRRNGVVRDDAYSPMPEKITIKPTRLERANRVAQGLETLSTAISAIESIASDVISIQEEVTEIKKNQKEYEDEKIKLSKEIEKKETNRKKASATPEIKEEDEQRYAA